MAFPKIVYNSVTLSFALPPNSIPDYDVGTVRNINIASSGVTEHIYERTDNFLEMDLSYLYSTDLAGWESFLDWARQGKQFDYYPDADSATHTTYTLENNDVKIAYKAAGIWQLAGLKFRKVV